MTALQIRQASAEAMLALVAVNGPPGAGKTLGALLLAHGLAPGGKIVVLDTEVRTDRRGVLRGRSETYRGLNNQLTGGTPLQFDVLPLEPPYTVARYVEGLEMCWKAGYDAVVVDSLSHEWFGILDQADRLKGSGGNQFTNVWGKLSPEHERFIDRLMRAPSHLICTMRTKMAYEIVDGKPKKMGMQPIQRDGVDYQFEVIFDVGTDHSTTLAKANANYGQKLADEVAKNPRLSSHLGQQLKGWLDGGAGDAAFTATVAQIEPDPSRLPEALRPDQPATVTAPPVNVPVAPSDAAGGDRSATIASGSGSSTGTNDEVSARVDAMAFVVPEKLAERVAALPAGDAALPNADANDFHAYLTEYLVAKHGTADKGRKAAAAAWKQAGVVVKKGATVTRDQAVVAAQHAQGIQ